MIVVDSPVGPLRICASETGITEISFASGGVGALINSRHNGGNELPPRQARFEGMAARQLEEYFAGKRLEFDLPLDFGAARAFSTAVWQRIARIPYGKMISYADIAVSIGKPNANRAVGQATGANPIAIVVPCHRVIGSNGSLTGFGGGIDRKHWLLDHEGVLLA